MHLCFITSEYPEKGRPHGGVGTFVQTLGRALVQKGCSVTVVGIGGSVGEFEDQGVRITRMEESLWPKCRFLDNAIRLNRCLRQIHARQKIDILETAEAGLAFLQKIPGIQYLVRLHGGHHYFSEVEHRKINRWKGWQERHSLAKADAIVGISRFIVEQTCKHFPSIRPETVSMIFNPVDTSKFFQSRSENRVPGRVVFIGTICEKKGIRQLIQAMPIIQRSVKNAHLVVAGRDWRFPDGSSYTTFLKKQLPEADLANIQFIGAIPNDEIPGVLESAAVCVFPSHLEGLPMAWLEALSMGKAFVGSNTGSGPEVVQDGITGFLIDPYDPEDIAARVIGLLRHPETAQSMGLKARADVLQRFDINNIVGQNLDLYQKILANAKPRH